VWKDYSSGYIKKNKAAGISIMTAAFIAALFISALCSLFYNMWIDEIRRSGYGKPYLLWGFYAVILILVCVSLILIIKSAFQFSMNARMRQMGILRSVGATPKQVRLVLLQEALVLSAAPVLFGTISGIGLCLCFVLYANSLTARLQISGAVFEYHYLLFLLTIICSFTTILLSALPPARKLGKISPLQAIKGEYEAPVSRIRKFRLLSAVFGIEGELSGKSLYTRRKAFSTASICLTVSFLAVSMFLTFMTLSEISTGHTYWERYKDAWDIMIEIKNPDTADSELLDRLKGIDGVDTLIAYQKNTAYTAIPESAMSDEVNGLGGYSALNGSSERREGTYLVETPIIALDNESYGQYEKYAAAGGSGSDQTSAIVVNTIWDSKNSRYRYKTYIPFLKQTKGQALKLYSDPGANNEVGEINVASYAEQPPNLREEYRNYSMVQIVPQSTYDLLTQKLPIPDKTMYITIRAVSGGILENIEKQCVTVIDDQYEYAVENRLRKAKVDAGIFAGYKSIMIAICSLLACIGIANVAANTLGYMYQRKREFARYQSVGLTPGGISKMLCAEMFVIGVKPILISVPFNILFILFAVRQSAIDINEFIAKMPVVQTFSFALFMLSAIALSYYTGSKQMKGYNIADALKDDTLY